MKWIVLCAGLLIAFGAVTMLLSKRQVKSAETAFPPVGQTVSVSGRDVHYVEKGTGPTVVLIHGASGNLRDFTFSLMDRLAQDFHVVAFDRPGLGYTDRVDPQFESAFGLNAESPMDQARFLIAATRVLGIENPLVVGHSFGGGVALAWGLEDQAAAGLVLVSAAAQPWPGTLGLYYQATASRVGGAVLPVLISAFVPDSRIEQGITSVFEPQDPPEGYASHIGAPLTVRPDTFRANARQVNGLRPHFVDMAPQYGSITVPVEIIHGTADTSVPLDIHAIPTAQAIPGANLTLLDGIGHMPHHSAEDDVVAAIYRAAERAGLR